MNKHEAPLTLRGQQGIAEILKRKPKYLGASLVPCQVFRLVKVGLGKYSRMTNLKLLVSAVAQMLKGNPKILGSSPSPRPHTFSCVSI